MAQDYTSEAQAQDAGVDTTNKAYFSGTNTSLVDKTIINQGSSLNQSAIDAGYKSASDARAHGYSFIDANYKAPSVVNTDNVKDGIKKNIKDNDSISGVSDAGSPEDAAKLANAKIQAEKDALKKALEDAANETPLTPEQQSAKDYEDFVNQEIANADSRAKEYQLGLDASYEAQLDGITASYERRKSAQALVNKSILGGTALRGARTGRQRYATDMHMDIMSKEEQAGLDRLGELDSMMRQELNAATAAYNTNNFNLYSKTSENIQSLMQQKRQAVIDQANMAAQQERIILEQSKFAFDVMKYEDELATGDKPIVVSPGSSIYDPATGTFTATAPKPLDTSAPETKTFNGMVNQWIPDATSQFGGSWVPLGTEKGVGDSDLTIAQKIDLAKGGFMIDNNGNVVEAPKPVDQAALANANEKTNRIKSVLTHPGLNEAVGPNTFATGFFNINEFWNSNASNFVADVETLISQESLDSLIAAKAKGATFGALSDTEMAILTQAATALGQLRIVKDGKVIGYKTTEKNFKEQMLLMKEKTDRIIMLSEMETYGQVLNPLERITEFGQYHPEMRDSIIKLQNPATKNPDTGQPYTLQEQVEILGIIPAFNKVDSDTNQAVNNIKDFSNVKTAFGNGVATGIEAGSKYWKYGLDLALSGGKGAPVKIPMAGTVVSAKNEGDWGNSVKVKLNDGRIVRLSHLDSINVKPGQRISAGTLVGGQGNTGKTYGKTGIHLDVTVYKADGTPYTSQEVASIFNTQLS